jgi:undecaprenyl-phosphate 4-deoxy-4-formamido-L-arabinose transferase
MTGVPTLTDGTRELDLSIVVPVYRSEDCLVALVAAISKALGPTGWRYEVILVNDGSPDRTWPVVEELCQSHPEVIGVDLRRNFGQDNAILTGFRVASGRAVAVMDDDLQHHPADLPAMLDRLEVGFDVVYAAFLVKRQKAWKNLGSWFNGRVAEWLLGKPRGIYLSPYKVIRREVTDLICRYDGPFPYVDGLLLQVTSRLAQVPVEHHARYAGVSTYSLGRSIRVWGRMVTSFSVKPLRLVTWCGLSQGLLGTALAAGVVLYRLLYPERFAPAVAGWASLMVALLLIGGVQMLFLGILGEYAGRTYTTIVGTPQAAIRTVLNAGTDRAVVASLGGRGDLGIEPHLSQRATL